VSACLNAGLLTRRKPAPGLPPRAAKSLPPHFFKAASNWLRVMPFGSPPPTPGKAPVPGPPEPGVRWGRVTPFFCRHSRIAEKRWRPAPVAGLAVEEPPVVEPPVVEPSVVVVTPPVVAAAWVEPPEEPHAVKPRQASARIAR